MFMRSREGWENRGFLEGTSLPVLSSTFHAFAGTKSNEVLS
jgi:hypothetical protein